MACLETIKPKTIELKIDGKSYEIKFTLESFAWLEEKFNSVDEAIRLFNNRNYDAIIACFEAALLHKKEKYNIQKIIDKAYPEELILAITDTMNSSLTSDYGFDKEWDWALLYFIAKPVLHLSEEDFWQSTPKKILSMLKIIEEIKGIKSEPLTQNEAIKSFMNW